MLYFRRSIWHAGGRPRAVGDRGRRRPAWGNRLLKRSPAKVLPDIPESVVVLDFGSQYSQLIARRIREARVYCELLPFDASEAQVRALKPKGIVLSGGPASVYEPGAPKPGPWLYRSGLPILGICYGMQLMAHDLGGAVARADHREYGQAQLHLAGESDLFAGVADRSDVWMSHGDRIDALLAGFSAIATTANTPHAAMSNGAGLIGLQFHPEVTHTRAGKRILENFLYRVCGCEATWTPDAVVDRAVASIAEQAPSGQVICGLSGGVDSAVAATLAHRALGDRLTCIFVDNGLLRSGEADQVVETFREQRHINLVHVDASERFLARLAGVIDPEEKRKRIGAEFIRVFEDQARRLDDAEYLIQGTLYPDVIESTAPETKAAAKIKTHHNVGGLPSDLQFKIVEPLRYLFKDEVRAVGSALGLPDEIVWRHPFPGPGLAVRVIGEVTHDRLETLRGADRIFVEELYAQGLYRDVSQALAVLTPLQSVGVMGDGRTYANVVALRAVTTDDFMTAEWSRLPYEFLARVSSRIVNEVPGVNRVVYDISTKPPATIEWE